MAAPDEEAIVAEGEPETAAAATATDEATSEKPKKRKRQKKKKSKRKTKVRLWEQKGRLSGSAKRFQKDYAICTRRPQIPFPLYGAFLSTELFDCDIFVIN